MISRRRANRRPSDVLVALSLLACLAAAAMWARSYWRYDEVLLFNRAISGLWFSEEEWVATSSRGGLAVRCVRGGYDLMTRTEADDYAARKRADGRWHCEPTSGINHAAYGDGSFARRARRTYAGFGVAVDEGYNPHPPAFTQRRWTVVVPWSAVAALFVASPAKRGLHALRRARADRRLRAGACAACGYDLTGNTSGVCPECGNAFTQTR